MFVGFGNDIRPPNLSAKAGRSGGTGSEAPRSYRFRRSGLTSLDQRRPGSRVIFPTSEPPTDIISALPFGNSRVSSDRPNSCARSLSASCIALSRG